MKECNKIPITKVSFAAICFRVEIGRTEFTSLQVFSGTFIMQHTFVVTSTAYLHKNHHQKKRKVKAKIKEVSFALKHVQVCSGSPI